jgi:hypothetical protein
MEDKRERRTTRRRKDRIALEFNYAQQRCGVNTMDVSVSGALIRTPVAFPSGTLLILEAPSLCRVGCSVRLLAKVVRASQHGGDPGAVYSGLGLVWIRAYCSDGPSTLRRFLTDTLGHPAADQLTIQHAVSGDAIYDFPAVVAAVTTGPALTQGIRNQGFEEYQEQRNRFIRHLKGAYEIESPIIYSVNNMHYRGTLVAIGDETAAFRVRGALPFPGAKLSIRYPLDSAPTAPRLILFAVAEMVLEPFRDEAGFFSVRLDGIDEMGNRGLFASHLRMLAAKQTKTW